MSSILLVEDEQHLAFGLSFNLEADGYQVEIVETGEAALERLYDTANHFDLVVLDVMLPGMDGFAVVSDLRAHSQFVPVLMLTARGRAEDVLQGFAAGADDYLPKPFELSILIARIKGLLRRRDWLRPPVRDRFEFQGKVIDFETMELHVGDKQLPLTLMEANLLRYLIQHQGKTISRKSMLEDVWGVHEDTDTRAIDNFIVRLRRYIEADPAAPRHLLTVRGVGYRFIAEPGA
ncbi:MAG: two component transcriptional regulator, winged helix family [Bryobacterales bacterium]|nr:two component transcriptional regulator, winged helix family [Bryobacterales bacterium]